MQNPNTEYERLVKQIHQGMLDYDGFNNIRVEHDVTITGKSGATHQIDVYWEFEAAGQTYKTCVECKNYSSPVKKLHVAAFAETLRDIGNANGIFATTSTYQKGAKLLAEENNIRLVQVNYLLKSIHLRMQPIMTNYENFNLNFNRDSVVEALKRNNLEKYDRTFSFDGEQELLNNEGEAVETFNTLIRKHDKVEGRNLIQIDNLFVKIENIGIVQLESLEVDISYTRSETIESIIESPNSATAVIEDIVNNVHYLHTDGTVNTELNNA